MRQPWSRLGAIALISLIAVVLMTKLEAPPARAIELSTWLEASFPVENFQAYTSPFGYRISPTNPRVRQFHRGLDLAAPMGSYVRNWWGGRVVQLSDHTACGTMAVIQSGQWKHIYCHLQGRVYNSAEGIYLLDRPGGIYLQLGQEISTGARIGRVGMTGRTTGPHLHWGLKYQERYIDPALVLKEMYRQRRGAPY